VVFGDATLAEMAASLPTKAEDFLLINGVGQRKMQRYGAAFMEEIINYISR